MSKKLVFLAGFFLLLSFVGIFLLRLIKEPSSFPPTVGIATPTPVSLSTNLSSYTNYSFSTLQKTEILHTTDQDLQALPNLIDKQATASGEEYQFQSANPLIPDTVVTNNGKVIFERTSTFTTDSGGLPNLTDAQNVLGKPEKVIGSNTFYGPVASSFLYPGKGITIIGNPVTNEVYEIQRYVPMSLSDYMSLYGEYVQETPVDNE